MSVLIPSVLTGQTNGTINIPDYTAELLGITAAIEAQTLVLVKLLDVTTNNANAMIDMKNEITAISLAMNSVKSSMDSVATVGATSNAMTAMQVSNQIKTNNFQMQATKDALTRAGLPEPTTPTITEQMTESVKESTVLSEVGKVEGFVSKQISHLMDNISTWASSFAEKFTPIKQIEDWVTTKLTALKARIVPLISPPSDVESKAANKAGIPDGNVT